MNSVLVSGRHTLPGWNVEKNGHELALVTSALLLFDRLVIPGYASLPDDVAWRKRISGVAAVDLGDVLDEGVIPPSKEYDTRFLMRVGLTLAVKQRQLFQRLYAPLFKAGLIRIYHQDQQLDFDTLCVGYTATQPFWRDSVYRLLDGNPALLLPPQASGGLYAAYLALVGYGERLNLQAEADRWLAVRSRVPQEQIRGYVEAGLLQLFHETYAAWARGIPILYRHPTHQKIHEAMLKGISDESVAASGLPLQRPKLEAADAVATRLLTTVFAELPVLIPRSPEAVLGVRDDLADELAYFRVELTQLSRELATSAEISDERVAEVARRELLRPLRDLHRKVAKPTRRLIRNLVSSPGLTGATIALMAGIATGGRYGALLAGLGAALTAATSTIVQERDAVESSQVAFLFRLQRRTGGDSSG